MSVKEKITNVLSYIYGTGIAIALLVGGASFLGYIAAMVIGGETATEICVFIYKTLYPILFYFSSAVVLLGIVKMYVAGEKSMAPTKRKVEDKK